MSGKSVNLLAMNQDFQTLHLRNICFEGSGDGIDGELFAQDSRRSGSCERF